MQRPPKIATIGEILVEMVSGSKGEGLEELQQFTGPFPSGAPAIFIDQVAKLGVACTIFGAVGADAFGRVNIDRLAADGVDVSNIDRHEGRPTGIAFVRYRPDGGRSFLFTLSGSASEQLPDSLPPERLADVTHLHVMGSGLAAPRIARLVAAAVDTVRAAGGTLSLDPNLRPEMLHPDQVAPTTALLRRIARQSDILLPSLGETAVLAEGDSDEARIATLLAEGTGEVALKRGADGASVFTSETRLDRPAPKVEEIDATGAGDCFGGTYVALRITGHPPADALRLAVNAGARSVGHLGPMEGTATLAQIESFAAAH